MKLAEHEIALAIDQELFVPYFQPLVDLRSGKIEGFEILARLPHPERGIVLPCDFIDVAERSGVMNGLTVSLLKKAFAAAKELPEPVGLSLNVSPLQLNDPTLPDFLAGLADEFGFDLARLTVEVTESALFDDLDRAKSVAYALKALGVRLSLDDFGTGYSSLLHLQALPFDELKVDAKFVRSMRSSRQSRKITASVVALGQSLGLRTVGEGVEELADAEMLLWHGCDVGQGWMYGRPMPAEFLGSFLGERPPANEPAPLTHPEAPSIALTLEAQPSARLPQLCALYEGVPAGVGFLDRELRYVSLNPRLADMHNLSIEAHLGRTVQQVVPDLYPQVSDLLEQALQGKSVEGVRVSKPSKVAGEPPTDLIVSYTPARDEAGDVIGISVVVLDVSITLPFAHSSRQSLNPAQSRNLFPSLPWTAAKEELLARASAFFPSLRTPESDAPRGL